MTAHFGALDGRELTLSDGLNILYAPNESGKSTWCAFLRTMLYGVSTSQRTKAGQKPDKVKYLPWSGAPMSGSMELETDLGPVTLRRWTERANQPMQAFSATVTGTDTPVKGLSSDTAGQLLTGMAREVFERTVFIRQAGLAFSNDPELDRRINAIVSSGDETVSFIEAQARLKGWQRHRRSGRRGAIPELEAQIARTEDKLDTLREQAVQAAAVERQIEGKETAFAAAEERMKQARLEQRKKVLGELAQSRERTEKARADVTEAEAAFAEAKDALAETPWRDMAPEAAERRAAEDRSTAQALLERAEKTPPVGLAFIPLLFAVTAFLLALLLPYTIVCAAAGGFFALLFAVMLLRLRRLEREKGEALSERQRILDAYRVSEPDELDGLLDNHRALWREKERAEERLAAANRALNAASAEQKRVEAAAIDGLDFVNGNNAAARAGREVERIRAELAALRESCAALEGRARATGDRMTLESELSRANERLGRLREQEDAITLALETLEDADAEMQKLISRWLAEKAAEYFSALTGGRYDELTLSRELEARARPTGQDVGREADYLSVGARDQMYLALRLAVCELALKQEDPCPMVLDDALVNFDRERMACALELVRTLSRERQVLLFTCHERECEYFADDPTVNRIRLSERRS